MAANAATAANDGVWVEPVIRGLGACTSRGRGGKACWTVPLPATNAVSDGGAANDDAADGETISTSVRNITNGFVFASFLDPAGRQVFFPRTSSDEKSRWLTIYNLSRPITMPSKRRLSVGPRRIEEDAEIEEVEANDDEAELQAMVQEREEQVRRKSLGITSPTAIRPGRKYEHVCVCVQVCVRERLRA